MQYVACVNRLAIRQRPALHLRWARKRFDRFFGLGNERLSRNATASPSASHLLRLGNDIRACSRPQTEEPGSQPPKSGENLPTPCAIKLEAKTLPASNMPAYYHLREALHNSRRDEHDERYGRAKEADDVDDEARFNHLGNRRETATKHDGVRWFFAKCPGRVLPGV